MLRDRALGELLRFKEAKDPILAEINKEEVTPEDLDFFLVFKNGEINFDVIESRREALKDSDNKTSLAIFDFVESQYQNRLWDLR